MRSMVLCCLACMVFAEDSSDGYGQTTIVGAEALEALPVTVTVLASEVTYGVGGEAVPVLVNLSGVEFVDSNTLDQVPVAVGDQCQVQSMFPIHQLRIQVVTPYLQVQTGSRRIVVLKNGDDLAFIWRSLDISPPMGGQRFIEDILGQYCKGGLVKLSANQRVYLFELGSDEHHGPAWDFQDLVLLVDGFLRRDDF